MNTLKYSLLTLVLTACMILSACGTAKAPADDRNDASVVSSSPAALPPAASESVTETAGNVPSNQSSPDTTSEITASVTPKAEEPKEETVISAAMNFSVTALNSYDNEETGSGDLFIYLLPEMHSHPYVRIKRLIDGTTAENYLKQTVEEISAGSRVLSEPGQPELLETDGRELYRISMEFLMDDLDMIYTGYAEDYDDDSVMFFCFLCEMKYKDTAEDVLQTAIDSVWVGELDEAAPADESADPGKTVAGRWSFTETPLASGDIEYCFDDALIMEIPAAWVGKVFWRSEGSRFSFYHSDSYKALKAERSDGGLLFSIGHYTDNSYEALPSYQYLGRARDGSYVMIFPFEDQLCTDDPELLAGWQSLFDSMTYILDNTYSMIFE